MPTTPPRIKETFTPATYRIKLLGRLDESWSTWFDGMAVLLAEDAEGHAITVLTGTLVDQAALYGLLSRIRDMGFLLLSVERLSNTGSS